MGKLTNRKQVLQAHPEAQLGGYCYNWTIYTDSTRKVALVKGVKYQADAWAAAVKAIKEREQQNEQI